MRKLLIGNHWDGSPLSHPAIRIPPELKPIPFSNAKTLLGQEFPYAVYDMRAESGVNFNLEAFAIVAGTIQENGTLYLLCPNWDNLEQEIDFDSLRWNDGKAIATPNFWRYFKTLVHRYNFKKAPLFEKEGKGEIFLTQRQREIQPNFSDNHYCQISPLLKRGTVLTEDQIHIFNHLPHSVESVHLITAPRGRGKSTLSGKLAELLAQDQPVIITSRAKAALPNFWKQIENQQNIDFFAPDRLIQAIENGENFATSWLFIDEAASLPLPILQKLCYAFEKVVMTTTTQNYEGTGRGFELKLPKMLDKPFKHWTLSQPLRWGENDPLEAFVTELLLLSEEKSPLFSEEERESWQKLLAEKITFYHLLATAHYKTTPSDLRRLFDGENQQLFEIREDDQLLAGAWGVREGGLDEDLTQAVWRGERRPKGNLVAQYLCFQANLPEACKLRSLRISRIAVVPEMQGKGYGKRLISAIILQISAQNPVLDFVSVSFGMSDELVRFWLQCGFQLVQISQQPEASSGLYSAMMIYPLSEQGKTFAQRAVNQFERDRRLQKKAEIQPLDEADRHNLWGFIYANRTFSACEMSLKRLAVSNPEFTLLLQQGQSVTQNQKQWRHSLRICLKRLNEFKLD